MSKSLQEQLLGANLVDGKKAKKIAKENRKAKNEQRRSKNETVSETQAAVLKAKQEKLEKDTELNRQKNAAQEKKALAAQVAQMIQHCRIARHAGDVEYNFSDGKTIKKILLTQQTSDEIIRGRLCIAKLNDAYEIIPRPIADKIRERDDNSIVVYNEKPVAKTSNTGETDTIESDEDYYAQFEIPDDLDW